MKKLIIGLSISLIVLLINSCDGNPFMFNLFETLDPYVMPAFNSADDILNEDPDALLDALSDDGVDPDVVENIVTILEAELSTPSADATADEQAAALLLAEVQLAASGVSDTIDGLNNLVSDLVGGDTSAIEGIDSTDDALGLIFPESQSVEDVESQLEALFDSAAAYSYYGETLGALGTSSELDGGEQTEVAFVAAISGITSYLVNNLATDDSEAARSIAITQLASSIVNGTPLTLNADPGLEAAEDPMEYMFGTGISAVIADGFTDLEAMLSSFGGA